jgi:hypothetical protein
MLMLGLQFLPGSCHCAKPPNPYDHVKDVFNLELEPKRNPMPNGGMVFTLISCGVNR